jgi:hypothetical protein
LAKLLGTYSARIFDGRPAVLNTLRVEIVRRSRAQE